MSDSIADTHNYGVDLFRIIVTYMVCTLHMLGWGGGLRAVQRCSKTTESVCWLLETMSYPAVDCYGLISGWVHLNLNFRISSLIYIWIQCVWTTEFALLLAYCAAHQTFLPMTINPLKRSPRTYRLALFPFSHRMHWYVTAYSGLYPFQLILRFCVRLTRKEYTILVIWLFVIFSLIPSLQKADPYNLKAGDSCLWLMFLYIVGGYIRLYGANVKLPSFLFIGLYFLCVIVTWSVNRGYIYNLRIADLKYTSPFTLLAAISLMLFFPNVHIINRLKPTLKKLSQHMFGVNIIHTQRTFPKAVLINIMLSHFFSGRKWVFPFYVLGLSFVVWVVSTVLDTFRAKCFHVLKVKQFLSLLDRFIEI